MSRLVRGALCGAAAGAAGTTALNLVTYLDMAARARPVSSTPEKTVEVLAAKVGLSVPGNAEARQNRVAGLGPLTGLTAGIGAGMFMGLLQAAGWKPGPIGGTIGCAAVALIASNGPMTALGVTDPRTWEAKDWAADLVPHLAYGAVTTAVLGQLGP